MMYWNTRACKPTLRCRGRQPYVPPWSELPPAPEAVAGYEQVTRGKHLFGGVYETFVNGEPIGPVYQGPGSPWWQPGMGDDNGQGWKWMARNGGMGLAEFGLLALLGAWVASAVAPVAYKMMQERR